MVSRCNISQSGFLACCEHRLHVGGNWDNSSSCGSRSVNGNNLSTNRNGNNGARLVSDTRVKMVNPEPFPYHFGTGAKSHKAEYCTLLSRSEVAKHTTGNGSRLVEPDSNVDYRVNSWESDCWANWLLFSSKYGK